MIPFSRREFFVSGGSACSLLALGFPWFSSKALGDEDSCELKNIENAISWESQYELYVWVDGFSFRNSDLSGRANLSLFLKYSQKEKEYVEKVVLTDNEKRSLGARYFRKPEKMSSGFPPYLVFHQVNLQSSSRYFLYVQIRTAKGVKKFRHTFTQESLAQNSFQVPFLPAALKQRLRDQHRDQPNTALRFRTSLGKANLPAVQFGATFLDIKPTGFFRMKIFFPFNAGRLLQSPQAIWASDPVGRPLGIKTIAQGSPEASAKEWILEALTESERSSFGITKDHVAKIQDCPFVRIFMEGYDGAALGTQTLWLR